jgi:DNA primase
LVGESKPKVVEIAEKNVRVEHFRKDICARLFKGYLEAAKGGEKRDLLAFAGLMEKKEDQQVLAEIMERKVNLEKAEEGIVETVKRILQRHWMEEREEIKAKIHSGKHSEEEVLELAKAFDEVKKRPPEVVV